MMSNKKIQRPIEGRYRQGDVVLERVSGIPVDAEPVKGAALAEGEVRHIHRFAAAANIELYSKGCVRYAR
jgi:hypothetical protein